jgi:aldehyde dehydrogenase (NAD+)
MGSFQRRAEEVLSALGAQDRLRASAPALVARSPIDGSTLAELDLTADAAIDVAVERASARFLDWRRQPAPLRGALMRELGNLCRTHKEALATVVTLETGKILSEARGEVQEAIDICEFAVGLSRQLHGLTIASERPEHKLLETWHPLGVCGIITAFNFPMAVWAWNAALALVCGNTLVWKPSEKAPLSALAMDALLRRAAVKVGIVADGLSEVVIGQAAAGERIVRADAIRMISATGSTRMGRQIGQVCGERFKRCILELGGNNAAIVAPSADLELALRAVVFAAAGTAGQRCTTTRRVLVHESIYEQFVERLTRAFGSLKVGNPLESGTLVGPLIDVAAGVAMRRALDECSSAGARVHGGEAVAVEECAGGCYVRPALVEMPAQTGPMLRETFAPILYAVRYRAFDEAIDLHNAVSHGLSSAIFTNDLREAELFTSCAGSDCGIANVNTGTSGAEIGGAFGGEKETGGGRESGSDAWKGYMRRATNTINFGRSLPLAQGVRFDI